MTDRILVAFEGNRAGTCGLSWGQRAIWGAVQRLVPDDAALNMSWITAIEEEGISSRTPVSRIVDTVRSVVIRHESLRTFVRVDADGEPYQVVNGSGEIAIEIVDAMDAAPAEVAAALKDRLTAPTFDYGSELPLRVGAVRTGEVVTHAIFVVCHLATDRGGLDPLVKDVLDGLAGKPVPAEAESPPLHPFDQALHQSSEAGRRQSEKALRYWERQLRSVPTSRFPGPTHPAREPRYHNAMLNSPAMDKAVSMIAARNRVSSSAVLLAATAVMLGRVTASRTGVLQLIVGNRFRPGLGNSVCPASQDGLCVIDAGDDAFDVVVGRAMKASMQAYMYSQYDPVRLDALIQQLGVDLSCSFNDRRFDSQSPVAAGTSVTAAELRAALDATTFTWEPPLDRYGARFFLHVNAASDAIELCLFADTQVLPPEVIEAYLRGMEALVVESACESGLTVVEAGA